MNTLPENCPSARSAARRPGYLLIAMGLLGAIAVLLALNIATGTVTIPLRDVLDVLLGGGEGSITEVIVLEKRLPEAVTALVAGGALGVCGLMMQTLFRNPLADPSILGISSGASLAVALITFCASLFGLSLVVSPLWQILAALAGSTAVLVFLLAVSRRMVGNTALLITGIMVGYLASALVSVLQFSGNKDANFAFILWSQGSFSRAMTDGFFYIFLAVCIVGVAASFLLIRTFNALLLGENYARNLGIDIPRARRAIILLSALLTGAVTAYCGPIAFVGLAVPHIVRYTTRSADRRVLLPLTVLAGAAITLLCALISKQAIFGYMLPINAVTSLIGAPIVILAVLKNSTAKN